MGVAGATAAVHKQICSRFSDEWGEGVSCAKMRPSEQNKHDQNKDWQMMKLALGSALLVAVTQTLATGLGPTQGDVIIGRPFDVLVQTRVEPGQGLADLCLQVRLQYGESQVPGTSLSTSLQSTGAGGEALLRVRSTKPINEPIVTLGLQVGCQTVFRRTYTLLADWIPVQAVAAADPAAAALVAPALVPRPGPNGAAATPAAAAVVPAALPQPPEQSPIRLSAPAARPAGLERLRSKAPPRLAQVPAASPVAIATPAAPLAPPPTVAAGARLQLDPIPMPAQASPVAAVAPEGAVAVAGALPDAPLAEVGAAQNVLAAPEQELLALRAEQEQLRLALQSTQAQLLQMQTQAQAGVPAAWLYGLGALLLLLLGGALYAHRSGRLLLSRPAAATPAPWWETTLPDQAMQTKPGFEPSQPMAAPVNAPAPVAVPVLASPGSVAETTNPAARAQTSALPAVGAPAASAPAVAPTRTPAALSSDWLDADAVTGLEVAEGRASMFAEVPVAVLDQRALVEAWQQAEFFESIAQRTQAMEVLKAFVAGHARASEAPYLRWLVLAAKAGDASELAEATRFYENHFQRMAPRAEAILAQRGLEHNVALLQTLQAQWPQSAAAEVIERALASQPGEPGGELTVRTLAAFDDLLTLADVLDAVLNPPMPMLDLGLAPDPSAPAAPAAPKSDTMSIDFDLGQLDWGQGKAAAKPDPDPSAQR